MSHIATMTVQENKATYIARIEHDKWDDERIVCSLWGNGNQGAPVVCVSVGDGACSDSAIEDALWDALRERAHQVEQAMIDDILAGVRESVRLGRLYAGL